MRGQQTMIDMKKTYRTRCGHRVRVLATDRADEEYPVVGLVAIYPEFEEFLQWTRDGRFLTGNLLNSEYDLIEVTE